MVVIVRMATAHGNHQPIGQDICLGTVSFTDDAINNCAAELATRADMTQYSMRRMRRAALLAMGLQGMLILMTALLLWLCDSLMQAVAVILGGAISLLPNLWFALRVLVLPAPLHAPQRISNLYRAEAIKLLLVIALFMLVFVGLRSVSAATVLAAFAASHVLYLLLQAWLLTSMEKAREDTHITQANVSK